jgi:tryptophan synthase alpha subunit
MTRLSEAVLAEPDKGRIAFLSYSILGFPNLELSKHHVETLHELGVTGYETAVPVSHGWSSDTNATIIGALVEASRSGIGESQVLRHFSNFRPNLYVLYKPVARPSVSSTFRRLRSFADGVLPEWDPSNHAMLNSEASRNHIELVNFVSCTMDRAEIRKRVRQCGLVYLAIAHATGMKIYHKRTIQRVAAEIKQSADIPVCCAFGIRKPSDVAMLASIPQCDGVIVGTAALQAMTKGREHFRGYISELIEATAR